MNANAFSQKDYENETALGPQKNKPNQSQFQTGHLGRYWQTKPKLSDELLRKVVEKC
ncbi:hypothetical protein ES703_122053 [subsurface metagenome]